MTSGKDAIFMGLFSWLTRKRRQKQQIRADSLSLLPVNAGGAEEPEAELELVEGRLMCSTSAYALPKDEREVSRLDLQHFILRNVLQGNYRAPIGQPGAILDVGAGTGRWAQEMAQAFPFTRVVGSDLVEAGSTLE